MILNHLQFNNNNNGHKNTNNNNNNNVFNSGFYGMAVGQPVSNIREHLKTDLPRVEFTSIEISDIYCRLSIEAQKSHNRDKNRYVNILPCDHSRVMLSEEEGSDYINANYINGEIPGTEKSYIATQGPLQHTRKDFWRMVWENFCFVIVMLGKDKENNRIKVDRYWPEEGEAPSVFGPFTITLLSRDTFCEGAIIKRRLSVQNARTQTSRIVTHFQYEAWPDHGVPKQSFPIRHLVRMVEQIRGSSTQATPRPPVIVHCSAGVGRTGAFITIHLTMEKIHRAQQNSECASLDFNIFQTVQRLRQQRPGMVQQQEQYFFCYETIAEEIEDMSSGLDSDLSDSTSDSSSSSGYSESLKTSDVMFVEDRSPPISDNDENSNGSEIIALRNSIGSDFPDFSHQRTLRKIFVEDGLGSGYSSEYESNSSSISSSAANSFCMEDEALV